MDDLLMDTERDFRIEELLKQFFEEKYLELYKVLHKAFVNEKGARNAIMTDIVQRFYAVDENGELL